MTSSRTTRPKPGPVSTRRRSEGEGEGLISHGQNIKQLINDALEIQDCFNTIRNLFMQLESNELTVQLVDLASECQEKFDTLLVTSRDSASALMIHLEDFTQNVVPLCQDEVVPLSDKLIEVKGFADMISIVAHQKPLKIREQLKELETQIKHVKELADAHANELQAYAQAPMQDISRKIQSLESHLTHVLEKRGGLLARAFNNIVMIQPGLELGEPLVLELPPSSSGSKSGIISFLRELFEACENIHLFLKYHAAAIDDTRELEKRKRELEWWKVEVNLKQADINEAIRNIGIAKQYFTIINSRIGNFDDIWTKLIQDINALNNYLRERWSPGAEREFRDRILAESIMYKEIRGALEVYAIQSQPTKSNF